jgi:hypothetical protein
MGWVEVPQHILLLLRLWVPSSRILRWSLFEKKEKPFSTVALVSRPLTTIVGQHLRWARLPFFHSIDERNGFAVHLFRTPD